MPTTRSFTSPYVLYPCSPFDVVSNCVVAMFCPQLAHSETHLTRLLGSTSLESMLRSVIQSSRPYTRRRCVSQSPSHRYRSRLQLPHIRHIRPPIDLSVALAVGVTSRLDYCNGLLYGTSAQSMERLQVARNSLGPRVKQRGQQAPLTCNDHSTACP